MFKLSKNHELGKELRMVVVDTLQELMHDNEKIVAMDADLGEASGWTKLQKDSPHRFINVGIAEANMVGVAAGLSLMDFVPFIHTFGPFATRRVFDQLFISGGYAQNTLNIYGSDPGFTAGHNGGTHTTWEDVALIRMIPHAIICDAADDVQMAWIIRQFTQLQGIHYVRGNRKSVHRIYEAGATFELGKGNLLKKGKDILLIAAGQLVFETLEVAKKLQEEEYSVSVIDMFTIKPIDQALLKQEMQGKQLVVTIENHSINGGLGSAVAEVIAEQGAKVPLKRIGVFEEFGQVGTPEYLQKAFGLSTPEIYQQIKATLIGKNKE